MNDICFGILNWNRDIPTNTIINKIPSMFYKDIVLCTNQNSTSKSLKTIEATENVAASKNKILKYALDNGYKYCFIIEDDLKILDNTIFDKYISLLNDFDLNLVMYGFNKRSLVLDEKPNPSMLIRVSENKTIAVTRFPCGGCMCFRVFSGMTLFDERLLVSENDMLTVQMKKDGNSKYNGFFLDWENSWNYFKRLDVGRSRKKTAEYFNNDNAIIGKVSLDSDADGFLNSIIDKMSK